MRKLNAVLIIDMQYDFCNPNGALFVPGAEEDCERLSEWIRKNKEGIDHISTTLDSHQVLDIAHPAFWSDKDGKSPAPFTKITAQQVKDGTWTPKFYPQSVITYLEALESQGEYAHCIWPEHCLIGTPGNAIEERVAAAITEWSRQGKFPNFVTKGTNPLTEHFGAFVAQVPLPKSPETQLNQNLIKTLEEYQNVYLAGEAKSHCVANTLKQVMKYAPALAQKFIILEDTMSPVPGFENLADQIYQDAKDLGVRFSTTQKESLGNLVTV